MNPPEETEVRGQRSEVRGARYSAENPSITNLSEPNSQTEVCVTYHTLISERFIELRGFGFALSPIDLRLIDDWEGRGVPSFIPLAVIEEIAERFRSQESGVRSQGNPKQRRPRSLAYIQEEVEARFAELVEGHVGCGGCDRPYCSRRQAA